MNTKTIDVIVTPPSLEDLLELISENVEVLFVKDNQPIARLTPLETSIQDKTLKPRIAGLHAGTTWTSDDFDDPLPDAFWLGEDA
jgi:antitoxin (DNA-binding transcriptional repressor) of toxin-antitoxin stability system